MKFIEILKIAWQGMRNNTVRSLLTMLGVVIGVTSVIILTSLGEGAKDQVSKQIQGLGSNLLMVTPGRLGWGGRGRGASGSANVLTTALMETIRAGMTTLAGVAGETSGSKTVV